MATARRTRHDAEMITRDRAVALAAERLARVTTDATAGVGEARDLEFGWLVRIERGAYLVDAETEHVYFVPMADLLADDWAEDFLVRCKGRHVPDAIERRIHELLESVGRLAALRELRNLAPAFQLVEARDYVDALASGSHPPRLLAPLHSGVGLVHPLPEDVSREYASMWTTERDDWYLATTRGDRLALPVHRGEPQSMLTICDDAVNASVVASMLEAGIEVVVLGA